MTSTINTSFPLPLNKIYRTLLLFVIAALSISFIDGFKSEADMIKNAEKLFAEKKYSEALEFYAQLASNHSDNADYSYKYGACLLYAGADKEEALKFLKFSVTKSGVDPMAYFFLGKAYQLNYYFKEAIKSYTDFKGRAPVKVLKEYDVAPLIQQCEEGKSVIQDIQSINVLSKKEASRAEFFRTYDLGQFDRKILVKPDDFKTKLDKKLNESSLIVHSASVQEVYFSSYGEKGENGRDIYKVVLFADQTKSAPLNVGPSINSPYDEDYPYLHPNGRILYFASKGHHSLGGYDIYRSELDTNTMLWGPAVNLGFAINSPDDDVLYVTDMAENVAYFASSRASAKDEITVFKIVPAKERIENTIIKGDLVAEANKQKNATITVTNAETGETVGVFKSNPQSGAYSMTLASSKKYKFNVVAPGYAPHEELVDLPSKKTAPIVNQKIQLKKTPAEAMAVTNTFQTKVDEVAFNEVYRKSASLDVNTAKDVGFNTAPIKKTEAPKTEAPVTETTPVATKAAVTDNTMVAEASEEAQELEKEYNKLKDETEAADYVYRVKNDEANEAKQEIVDLTRQLNQTNNAEEKKKIQVEIDNKVKDLRKKAREASITQHYADQKKTESKNKKEEADAAKHYAGVIKEATETKNSDQAIAKLEAQRKKLDEIQERNSQSSEVSMQQSLAATKANKDQEIKSTETEIAKIDAAIKLIEADQKNLKKQIDATKNQQIKDELNLQLSETKEELAARQSDKMIAEAQLAAIKSETTEESQETQVIADLQQEVNTVKTQDVAVLEAERKKQIATEQKAKTQIQTPTTVTPAAAVPNTKEDVSQTLAKLDTVGKKNNPAEKYNDEMAKAKMTIDLLTSVKEEQAILETALKSTKSEAAKAQTQKKIDDLKLEQEKKNREIAAYAANANKIKEEAKLTPQQIASAPNKLDETQIAAVESYSKSAVASATPAPAASTPPAVAISPVVTPVNPTSAATSTTAPVVVEDTVKSKVIFPSGVAADKATPEQKSAAALAAFGLKSQNDTKYSSTPAVSSNVGNARTAENEALNLYTQAEQKKREAAATANAEDKKKLNKEAEALEKAAKDKQLVASENYFLANRAEYDNNQAIIKQALQQGKLKVDSIQLTELENMWLKDLLVRKKVKSAKDFKEKVTFINDASQKEALLIQQQQEMIKGIKEPAVAVVNTPKAASADTAQKVNAAVVKTTPAKVNEAFGVAPTPHEYSKDEQVQTALAAVNTLEEDASKNYDEAQTLKQQAAASTKKSEAKKLNKEAIKKIKLGRAKMKQAMAKRGELNKTELQANKLAVQEAIEKKGLVLNDQKNKELKAAEEQFKKGEELRLKAKKTKSFAGQTDLNNQANALESAALESQRKVMEVKHDKASAVAKVSPADSIKAKNIAIKDEVRNNQQALDQNQNRINVVQNDALTAQQKDEVIKLQKEVNALIAQSREQEIEAANTTNPELASAVLNHADELKKQALAKQQQILAIKENKIPAVPVVAATNASNSAKKTPEAAKEYNAMLTEAQLIEKEITSEVAQYIQLKKESKNYQVQSEQALAKGNAAEADRLKNLADQKEEQALQSSMVIDNSRLEAKSKREEAKLYLQSLNPQVAKEVDAKSADKNTQTDAFVAYKEKSDKEVVAATPSLTAATTKAANPAQNTTAAAAKIDVANSPVFGGKSQDVQAAVIKDQFAIQSNVAYSAAQPIPVDVPLPEGLVYTVQVGAFRNPIPQDLFKGISPLFGEKTPMGFIRYTAGTFRSFKAAAIAKDKIRQMGYPDAFVVPYYNGKRISMDQADQVTAKADVQTQNALQVIEAREVESINKVEVKNPVAIAPVAAENRATSIDVSASDKLFYTVQIGVFSREIKKGSIYDMQPLNVERTTSGLLRYSVGKYDNLDAANKRKAEINTAGIADAFVIAYKGGQRIAVADAQAAGAAAGANTTVTATKNNSAATVNAANITFKVQVGAYAKDVPVETTTLFFNLPAKVEYYKDASGITIFNVGNFTSIDDARKLKDQVLAAGLTDAFIVAYQGKEKISVDKALELLKK